MLTWQKLLEYRTADQATADRLNAVDRALGYDGTYWTVDAIRERRKRLASLSAAPPHSNMSMIHSD